MSLFEIIVKISIAFVIIFVLALVWTMLKIASDYDDKNGMGD
jgi:nitrogen fixation-related uncharacterized protein